MDELQGKVVVITGGESGIGRAISNAFATAGAQVVIGGQLEEQGAEAVSLIAGSGGSAEFHKTDVRRWADIDALISGAIAARGRLDVLVNNAGVFDGFASVLETSEELWDSVIDINLKGQFLACKRALQHMVPLGTGRIINISSVGGLRGAADGASYTASKFAINGLTRQLACTYAETGITCNAICPGVIETGIRANSAKILGSSAPDMLVGVGSGEGYKALVPAKRKGRPEEIAALALFLASQSAAYINGQTMAVDGGWTAT